MTDKRALGQPVTLGAMKRDARLRELPRIRQWRLSVLPVSDAQWVWLLDLAGTRL